MKNERPKVCELAESLGVGYREVLAAAADLGVKLQNRISRVDADAERRIRAHIQSVGANEESE